MNRFLEMEKDLMTIRKKRKSTAKPKPLSSSASVRTRVSPRFSHEMASFKEEGLSDGNVWTQVRLEDNSQVQSISQFTRVKNVKKKDGREYFTIIDWPYEGKAASVKAPDSGSRFKTISYDDTGGIVTYNIAKKELRFGTASPIKSYMSDPLPKGEYKLRLPDAPHAGGNSYTDLSKFATVWFKIDQSVDDLNRYLHVGRATAGCMTCGEESTGGGTDDDRKRWTEVYNYLITRRPGKGTKYVGTLKIE